MSTETWLLFCDLESSGLNTQVDEIIEAAFILTDTDLNELSRWEQVFQPSWVGMERLFANKDVREMHAKNGLLNDIASRWFPRVDKGSEARDVLKFGKRLLQDLPALGVGPDDMIHLAGSGVAAFDRPLIRRWMPDLDQALHYAPIDVGVLRRTWKMWTGSDITGDNAAKDHRAASDVAGHLREAQAFRERFKVVHEALAAKD